MRPAGVGHQLAIEHHARPCLGQLGDAGDRGGDRAPAPGPHGEPAGKRRVDQHSAPPAVELRLGHPALDASRDASTGQHRLDIRDHGSRMPLASGAEALRRASPPRQPNTFSIVLSQQHVGLLVPGQSGGAALVTVTSQPQASSGQR